ncbi:Transcriptional regulator, GntR family [Pseudomonas cannabina pv. alisalensis]|uniref:Transcriptional regulator, GntR family n=2 Tax=Pseudomonas cannabina TaxID=86840 RepID=A0A3M3QCD7_PSECA|nr:PLP-dependent aminotransferase family protein [Pseudomonas cannabina]KPW20314.1 Transcriptional regulator, GntR family [Pseudomonas cannabina pv. alisalensis]MBM0138128.1 PLP-dependent aminotransferase family protein [Pseudomonas cannabina pv. alisalensis]RMN81847.1 Transcriptional regulator, GntR family [Pseudomonas cannabina]RMN85652.1 Transcriptional regulator, GntR family [Pseudomonas cannabina pv. alisalensis]RMN87019.1 Transcriptional regulator, GntR family [Pseudomonas cannabina]
MTPYLNLAELISSRIEQGLYGPGERLPSVRTLSNEHGVSLTTVQQAYRVLEYSGLAIPRPKSGYFVPTDRRVAPLPQMGRPVLRPVDISQWDMVQELMRFDQSTDIVQLGCGMPDISVPTLKPLLTAMSRISRSGESTSLQYNHLQGVLGLREQIARLSIDSGCRLSAADIMVTSGCQEALAIAIRAICAPGDIVAVASPSYYGMMQILKAVGLKALEIPTDPVTGMNLEALEMAMEQWPIKAIQLTANCNNPLGYIMPDDRKLKLVRMAQRFDVPIIEDDIYGDLSHRYPRPRSLKSFDEDNRVVLCSSFSKTVAPGLRVGWIVPGRYLPQVLHMKFIGSGSTATQPQLAVAEFIAKGNYLLHLRRMRKQYKRNSELMIEWVNRYFPAGTRVSQPQGGFTLWVELPEEFDTHALNRLLEAQEVQVANGNIFSAAGKYRNCLRLNFANPPTSKVEKAVLKVGQTISQLVHLESSSSSA